MWVKETEQKQERKKREMPRRKEKKVHNSPRPTEFAVVNKGRDGTYAIVSVHRKRDDADKERRMRIYASVLPARRGVLKAGDVVSSWPWPSNET